MNDCKFISTLQTQYLSPPGESDRREAQRNSQVVDKR